MVKINGELLGTNSYKINKNGKSKSLKTILHQDTGLNPGDRIYEYLRPDGVIEIIPESLLSESERQKNKNIFKNRLVRFRE